MKKQKVRIHRGDHFLDQKYIGCEGVILSQTHDVASIDEQGHTLKGFRVQLKKYKKPMMFYENELTRIK